MSANLTVGITGATLVIFILVIIIGYVQLDSARQTTQTMNKTITTFIDSWDKKQAVDNIRFNTTLKGLAETYNLIVDNQGLIINSSNNTNTLVKFLADNFGAQSGYLERENFQYARANKTFDMITALYENQTR